MKLSTVFLVVMLAGCANGDFELLDNSLALDNDDIVSGMVLFDQETFDGNGRTCRTCHSAETGTLSVPQVRNRLRNNPNDPLFLHDGLDDGVSGTDRISNFATIRVELSLPTGVTIASAPSASSVVVNRGIPSTRNSPALDSVIMWDGREPTLESQAESAILGHAQAARQPTDDELSLIALFETAHPRSFSSPALMGFAAGGPEPVLPPGITPAERRGRAFFVPGGRCAACHGGPMLNTANNGARFIDVLVSRFNNIGNPVYTFTFADGVTVDSPDPGLALITGNSADVDRFKISTLWGVRDTAPYFHDNSARNLADVVRHYSDFFVAVGQPPLSPQAQADIVAYLRLL